MRYTFEQDDNTRYCREIAKKHELSTGKLIQGDTIDYSNICSYTVSMNERLTKLEVQSEQYKNDISEIKKEISNLKYWFIGTIFSIVSILITVTNIQINSIEKTTAMQLDGLKNNNDSKIQMLNEKYVHLEKQLEANHQEILSKIEKVNK